MKFGRAKIGIFQKMRNKILRGGQWGPIKKNRLLHLGNVEKAPIRNFLRNERLRVNFKITTSLFYFWRRIWNNAGSYRLV